MTIWSAEAGWVPNQAEIAGEVDSLASQMPGGYSNMNYAWFSVNRIWYSGAWRVFDGPNYITPGGATYFGYYRLSQNDFGIWDKACAS